MAKISFVKFREAVGDSLCTSFFTDALCELLSGGQDTSNVVKCIFSKILQDSHAVSDADLNWVPQPVQAAMKRIRHVTAAFVTVLDPAECVEAAGMDDLQMVKKDESGHNMMVTAKALLFGAGGYYNMLSQEMEQKAGSSQAIKTEYNNMLDEVKGMKERKEDIDLIFLKKVLLRFPVFVEKMRDGATKQLGHLVLRELQNLANEILAKEGEEILAKEGEEQNLPSPDTISTVIKGLELFMKEKGVVELLHRLQKFKEAAGTSLGVQGFLEAVQRCVLSQSEGMADILRKLPIKEVTAALDGIGGLPQTLPPAAA